MPKVPDTEMEVPENEGAFIPVVHYVVYIFRSEEHKYGFFRVFLDGLNQILGWLRFQGLYQEDKYNS